MKKFIIGSILAAIFIVPGVASAHSGSVSCDSTGVVFHYNTNFPVTTTVTEHVNGVDKTFVVHAYTAATDTIPAPAVNVVASSTWVGGGTIPPTTLVCPFNPPTPPVTPVCAEGDVSQGIQNGVLVCVHTVTVTNTVTVHDLVPPPVYTCPKGYKQNNFIPGLLTCTRTITKIKTKTKIVKQRVLIPWCPLPPHKTPGVAG